MIDNSEENNLNEQIPKFKWIAFLSTTLIYFAVGLVSAVTIYFALVRWFNVSYKGAINLPLLIASLSLTFVGAGSYLKEVAPFIDKGLKASKEEKFSMLKCCIGSAILSSCFSILMAPVINFIRTKDGFEPFGLYHYSIMTVILFFFGALAPIIYAYANKEKKESEKNKV